MGSLRFGKVAEALSSGLGLFAMREVEKEREEARKQWDLAMAELRERQAGEREDKRAAVATERYLAGQKTQQEATAATAQHRKDVLEQGESQFGRSMDADMVADEKKALRARLENLYDRYQDAIEASPMGEDLDGRLAGAHQKAKDEAISNFVVSMASATDSKGKLGAPGFKNMDSAEAFSSKMIANNMSPEAADRAGADIYAQLTSASEPDAPYEGHQGQKKDWYIPDPDNPSQSIPNPNPAVVQQPPPAPASTTPNTAAMPIDMLGDGGIPAAGTDNDLYRSPNQRAMEKIINPAGRAIKDWLGTPEPPDDVYKVMGQRGSGR